MRWVFGNIKILRFPDHNLTLLWAITGRWKRCALAGPQYGRGWWSAQTEGVRAVFLFALRKNFKPELTIPGDLV